MKIKPLPSVEILKSEFEYNPKTGVVLYKKTKQGRSTREVTSRDIEGYYRICFNKTEYRLHRIIYKLYYGNFDETLVIDHINGDVGDNRIANLRLVNIRQNSQNQKIAKNNTSGYSGICYRKQTNRYRVSIVIDGKNKEIANCKTLEEAVDIRKQAEKKYGYHKNHGRRCAML